MPVRIRRIVDVVSVVGALGVLTGFAVRHVHDRQRREEIRFVAEEVRRFELTIKLHAATEQTDINARGWPIWIDPTWFEGSPPRNTLLTPDRPWVEVATAEQSNLLHPQVRVATEKEVAGFWYNPYQGIVRARVPQEMSDEQTRALYNAVNGADLESIFADTDPVEVPIPPGAAPADVPAPASEAPADEALEPAVTEPAPTTVPKRPEPPMAVVPGRSL